MASTNFVVSSLPDYVQTNRDLLIKNFALVGTATRRRIGIQTGIKKDAYLNYLDLAATLQSGDDCGFDAAGSITLTQRIIETARIKVQDDICPQSLVGKYAEYLVRINATEKDLPFEQYIIEALVAEVNKKIEKLIWLGDTSSADTNIKWIDGFLIQMNNDADVIPVSISAGTTAYDGLVEVYAAIPEEALERGAAIFVSPAIYRAFLMDMVRLNYYHYSGPQASAPEEFILPGTDVRVIKTPGLAGSLDVVATFPDNLVYGCDAENDNEDIDIWYSQDDRVWKYEVLWNSGVAYHFPDQIVLGTFAAAPTATAGANAALAAIAGSTADIATAAGELADADHVFKTKEQA